MINLPETETLLEWVNMLDWGWIQSEYTGDGDGGKTILAVRDFLVNLLPAGTELEYSKEVEERRTNYDHSARND